jgi:hypothetical protein
VELYTRINSLKKLNNNKRFIMTRYTDNFPQAGYSGNIFLLIQEAFAKNMEATNDGIATRYEEEAMLDKQYQAGLNKWQADASKLPDAGKLDPSDAQKSINGTGMAVAVGIGALIPILLAVAYSLGTTALGLSASGVGAPVGMVVGAIAAIIFAVVAILVVALVLSGVIGNTDCHDWIPGHENYDPGKQSEATSLVQADQAQVSQLQNMMNKLMSQYINPANDTKSQDANMIQGAIQWMKAMMWTQGAA